MQSCGQQYNDAHLKTEAYFQNDFKTYVKKTEKQDLCIGFKGSEYSTVAGSGYHTTPGCHTVDTGVYLPTIREFLGPLKMILLHVR